jgi:hypothetical protein
MILLSIPVYNTIGLGRSFYNLLVPLHTNTLKSTCDVNPLSKLSIIFKGWRVIVLFVLLRSHKGQAI